MPSLSHHLEQSSPRLMIFMMAAQMPTKPTYALGKQCYLDLSGASILIVSAIFLNNGLFPARILHASWLFLSCLSFNPAHYITPKWP